MDGGGGRIGFAACRAVGFAAGRDAAAQYGADGRQKASADVIAEQLLELMLQEYQARYSDPRGVHIETVLSNLGALAGFGVQMGIREGLIVPGKVTEKDAFVEVAVKNGEKYYFGDFLNEPLFSLRPGKVSVFLIVGSAADELGAKTFPDLEKIAERYARVLGKDDFYRPDLPKDHMPRMMPIEALGYWSRTRDVLVEQGVEPLWWGWIYATAARTLMKRADGLIDPKLAVRIVMEAAVPMSKIEPGRVDGAYLQR